MKSRILESTNCDKFCQFICQNTAHLHFTVSASILDGDTIVILVAADDIIVGRIFRVAVNKDRFHHTLSDLHNSKRLSDACEN